MMLGGKTWGQQQQGKTQWIKIKRGWRQWSAAKKVYFSLFWLVLPKGPWGPQPLIAISCCVVTHVFISCLALSARKTKNNRNSSEKYFVLCFILFFVFVFFSFSAICSTCWISVRFRFPWEIDLSRVWIYSEIERDVVNNLKKQKIIIIIFR